jgi:hypothetical protein
MITDSHLDELKAIFIKHGVILAYLFGSHAEGRARLSSDVDIAVLLPHDMMPLKTFDKQFKLMAELEDALAVNEVDVVILNEAPPLLAFEVVKHGKVLYEDPVTRPAVDFAARTISVYADTAYFRRLSYLDLVEGIEHRRRERQKELTA